MTQWQGKRYWLVGASDGLGAALAGQLSRAGAEVVLSARSEDKLKKLADSLPGKAQVVTLDVSDMTSVEAAAKSVGEVDGVVYLAGAYWPFGAQNWNAEQANTMADVNFTGLMRVLGQVVPDMVKRDAGHIVITSSLTGFRGLPNSIGYTASKAAVMSLAECMHADLRKTGVQVQVVNPGFIRTQLTDKNDFKMPFLMEPEDAAREVFEHMNTDNFKKSFPYFFSLLFRGSQFLPDWLYFRLFR
ncbi:SDR family NAD(P)-dependent oxidoreductase [Sulfitobacter sp. F26169L]|uniref:SDR family NAD(P)-dependent oxidoreductase n=1 Tax=Sulfitobacter sp. F26169L TaxID=2996015 RepID=UPI002260941A|nr:SDR family NAD(P)-dependent oxidoreductase [Sulfitobacter sp. F26169L]MCX7565598.1 SDR family NAD(P)-dependent oxidoreductase [Sulfitobacter sp. F26169L]